MTLSQRVRSLSFDELLIIADTVEKETARRNDFINCLAGVQLKALGLTNNTRDLLYRIVHGKISGSDVRKGGDFSVRDLFCLLKKEDWLYIDYLNPRAFLEIRDALSRHEAPLDNYYGLFPEKSGKAERIKSSSTQRLVQVVDAEVTK